MIPQKNQYVKILLKPNIKIDGWVEEWNDKQIVILSEDEDTYILIQNPSDILLISIPLKISGKDKNISVPVVPHHPEIKLPESDKSEKNLSPDLLKIKKLAELKKLQQEQEMQDFHQKMYHHSSGNQGQKYELPGSILRKK